MGDQTIQLIHDVKRASKDNEPLEIVGRRTKEFLGRATSGTILDISQHTGIINYEPAELILMVRAGTPLSEIRDTLAGAHQCLLFDPPHYGVGGTIGGIVAAGLAGPCRPYTGAVRDFVLGLSCINGAGEHLHFGGQVMKNVAGYDVSRLMVGAMGTLGPILDISFKVMPMPELNETILYEVSEAAAISKITELSRKPWPFSGACYLDGQLRIRLSGGSESVLAAARALGGEHAQDDATFWQQLRDQTLPFFRQEGTLWRINVRPNTTHMQIAGAFLIDWGGAQRWLRSEEPDDVIRDVVARVGGHASRFRGGDREGDVFHPLSKPLQVLHRKIKETFDPLYLFNRGRMYAEI
ncbi:MAG: glycolate oxidase subunit GlcE [Acidiferrobacteraceae bacterium]|nr:glycolate oxidase subunit GlcE [Acidiferrobacteraceae bacterium]